jgi:ergothioneine biosynthesis protein EgtB
MNIPCTSMALAYAATRQASVDRIATLTPEDCQVQSMPDASPSKWHLAHTTWFFETFVLERFEPQFKPFNPHFRHLFNSYYQGLGAPYPRAQRGLITQPLLNTVLQYRQQVDERIQALLADPTTSQALTHLVTLGLHHEQQHQELLVTDIKHALSFVPEHTAYATRAEAANSIVAQPLHWVAFEGGLIHHGFNPELDGAFSFDNEGPCHRAYTAPFELASRPVSYSDYLEFINDAGYGRAELWLSTGWEWVQSAMRKAPLYWQPQSEGMWQHHTLQGLLEVDLHAPVCHLSYFEADAYARWAGARLPTEVEWEHAARCSRSALPLGHFAHRGQFHPSAATSLAQDQEVQQLFGDVWEWTQSSYAPYPGYCPAAGAVGEYNGKFMCNQYVLRGGSCATPQGHVRASYRNFFSADAQWQFSGLRLAR